MKTIFYLLILIAFTLLSCVNEMEDSVKPTWMAVSSKKVTKELISKYGEDQSSRIQRGLKQVCDYWRTEDGDANEFESFILTNYAGDSVALDAMFHRFQQHLEKLYGHLDRVVLNFREQADLDRGIIYPFDELFAAYAPGAHITSDFFKNKLAFVILLNFPLSTLDQRSTVGMDWSRREWAETRLASRFTARIPAEISQNISKVSSESQQYIANYNIWMHHLIDNEGKRLFPPKMRLLSHWNLRDELKAHYARGAEGLPNQRIIQKVMERIVDQTIPQVVIDNPSVDWNPFSNDVSKSDIKDYDHEAKSNLDISKKPEPNTRYVTLQKNYQAQKSADPYWPTMPNFIRRRFDRGREIQEKKINQMFDMILTSPHFAEVAKLIQKNIGRDLEPFDIWYNGFRPRSKYSEDQLDKIVSKKYPDAAAFKKDISRILKKLGFAPNRINEIAPLIEVDPARGSGHAWGAQMKGAAAHLRTRISHSGMDYKGYNIAIHELGHNVEQVISLNSIDFSILNGVPNNAFTEALAFVFQARDLELLGLERQDSGDAALKTINDFWQTCEIAGVSLVDIAVWHWMYDHPQAKPGELRDATIQISRDVWNRYFAPAFGVKDSYILGIYSHMISYPLYLADYPLGHLIAYQVEEKIKSARSVGEEFDRIARIGNVAPDLWMTEAAGAPVGPEALLSATKDAIDKIQNN